MISQNLSSVLLLSHGASGISFRAPGEPNVACSKPPLKFNEFAFSPRYLEGNLEH